MVTATVTKKRSHTTTPSRRKTGPVRSMPLKTPPRIIIAAGGTGGHVYPAISIAEAVREKYPHARVHFVGTKNHIEWKAVPEAGFNISSLWISGFHRRFTLKNLIFPLKLISSLLKSRHILNSIKPELVVSCGGYAAGPIGWVAAQREIPIVIQEQNSYPGITNRLLAKYADKIFTAFEQAKQYLPAEKVVLTGNPTRKELAKVDPDEAFNHFQFDPDRPVLLVLGGSGGARSINDAMIEQLHQLHDELGLQIIWQCGKRYLDYVKTRVHAIDYKNLRLMAYIDRMDFAYHVAGLVISRAGAGTCSELMNTGNACVLIPSPYVAENHQHKNASAMVEEGAAVLLEDHEASHKLAEIVGKLIKDEHELERMRKAALALARPNAAGDIADQIEQLIAKKRSEQNTLA